MAPKSALRIREAELHLPRAVIAKAHPDSLRVLLERGANPLVGVGTGSSAFEWAITLNDLEVVELFLETISSRQYRCDDFVGLIPKQLHEIEPQEMEELTQMVGGAAYDDEEEQEEEEKELWWVRFLIIKAMTRHYWRLMYPVPAT